ncbi:MAG: hypothetical protein J6I31_02165 [Prevotella sp.]|nr:hypothetical protein [Prevotella sp.]
MIPIPFKKMSVSFWCLRAFVSLSAGAGNGDLGAGLGAGKSLQHADNQYRVQEMQEIWEKPCVTCERALNNQLG